MELILSFIGTVWLAGVALSLGIVLIGFSSKNWDRIGARIGNIHVMVGVILFVAMIWPIWSGWWARDKFKIWRSERKIQ